MPRTVTATGRRGRLLVQRNSVRVKHLDVFTDTPMAGNPTCVVADAVGLSDETMLGMAREFGVPATTFVLPPRSGSADLRIRWFGPRTELQLCGHGTIGTLVALAHEKMFGLKNVGTHHLRIETAAGILPGVAEISPNGVEAFLGLPFPEFVQASGDKLDIMRVFSVGINEFDRSPIVTSGGYIYVPLRRLHTLFSLKPNTFSLSQFLSQRKLLGLCVFTTETIERKSHFHSRFFAPPAGIAEDPVTGSANGPVGVYLFEQNRIPDTGNPVRLIGEQGDTMRRPGRVSVRLRIENGKVSSVHIGGTAVVLWDSEMRIR